jgi:hypothetical protein
VAFGLKSRIRLIAAAAAALAAAFYDVNPLFWISIGCGVLILSWLLAEAVRRDFLAIWAVVFFAGAMLIFFAGSARYLLPIAAPVAILATRTVAPRWLAAGFASQLLRDWRRPTTNTGTVIVLCRHASLNAAHQRVGGCRVGPALLPESAGALPLSRIKSCNRRHVSSELARPVTINAPLACERINIVPGIPLRLISLSRLGLFQRVRRPVAVRNPNSRADGSRRYSGRTQA